MLCAATLGHREITTKDLELQEVRPCSTGLHSCDERLENMVMKCSGIDFLHMQEAVIAVPRDSKASSFSVC